jgi:hypothetical protein
MKKITFIFVALFFVFSASAQDWGGMIGNIADGARYAWIGNYDPDTKVFEENGNPTQISNFNPECFTMAILVKFPPALTLFGLHKNYTFALNQIRMDDTYYFNLTKGENPLIMNRVDNAIHSDGTSVGGIVFYVCGVDLGGLAEGSIDEKRHLMATMFAVNPINPADFWWDKAFAAKSGGFLYIGDKNQNMKITTNRPDCGNK